MQEFLERRDKQEMWNRIIELETRLSALTRYLGVEYQNHSEYVKVKEEK
jgi:hypothetical protein